MFPLIRVVAGSCRKEATGAGESAEAAALREVREEAGIECELLEKIETIEYWYVADNRGRRWIGIDQSDEAIKATKKRLAEMDRDLFNEHASYQFLKSDS